MFVLLSIYTRVSSKILPDKQPELIRSFDLIPNQTIAIDTATMSSNGAQYFLSKVRAVEKAKASGQITDERIQTMMKYAQTPLKLDTFGDRSTKKELTTYVKVSI